MASRKRSHTQLDDPFRAVTPRQLEVLNIIRDDQVITRAEIGTRLHTSASQVSRLTAPLIALELVTVEPRLSHVEGRPADLLSLTRDRHYVAGLDIGGMAQEAVIANLHGELAGSAKVTGALPDSRAAIVAHLAALLDTALVNANVAPEHVLGVGVGVRAIVDPVSGIIAAGPETPSWSPLWSDFDLRAELERALPWKQLVVDDTVRALAAVERRLGAAAGSGDFVYLLADSGIGAALMIDGRPYIGPGHLAGEAGHITLDPDGPVCGCGRRGCVECYASISAMIECGQALDPGIETIDDLISRADAGDARMRQILADGGAALGRALAILLNLLSPALIVIGGAAVASTIYLESARAVAKSQALGHAFGAARIVPSTIRAGSGAQGAATLILDELFAPSVLRDGNDTSARLARTARAGR